MIKMYLVVGLSRVNLPTDDPKSDNYHKWSVAVYFDKRQAEFHTKALNNWTELHWRNRRSTPVWNPYDPNSKPPRAKPIYEVVEVESYDHFDQFQEEKGLV